MKTIKSLLLASLITMTCWGTSLATTDSKTSLAAEINTSPTQTSSVINNLSQANTENYTGELKNFPSRKVAIVATSDGSRTATYKIMLSKLSNVFRYPYYSNTISYDETETKSNMTEADIIIKPTIYADSYRTFHPVWGIFNDDFDETYVRAYTSLGLTYTDNKTGVSKTIRHSYSRIDDSLTVPSHNEIINKLMDKLLKDLPYKRVPTDIDINGNNLMTITPEDDPVVTGIKSKGLINHKDTPQKVEDFLQVDQPKSTKFSLQGVSVL